MIFAVGLINSGPPWSVDPTGFITLGAFQFAELLVFLLVGWFAAIAPSYAMARFIWNARLPDRWCVSAGLALGVAATPICAGVAFVITHDNDAPSYVGRLQEYVLPMVLAGLGGGLSFGRCAAKARRRRDDVAKLF